MSFCHVPYVIFIQPTERYPAAIVEVFFVPTTPQGLVFFFLLQHIERRDCLLKSS